jgi:hypothetical protein
VMGISQFLLSYISVFVDYIFVQLMSWPYALHHVLTHLPGPWPGMWWYYMIVIWASQIITIIIMLLGHSRIISSGLCFCRRLVEWYAYIVLWQVCVEYCHFPPQSTWFYFFVCLKNQFHIHLFLL